jgi:C4-dicarboxylate-specific signal transduction histidine kinase
MPDQTSSSVRKSGTTRGEQRVPSAVRTLAAYGAAIAIVFVALGISLVLPVRFGNPFWFFFAIAVIFITWMFGRGPGWVTVGLSSTVVLYDFVPPVRSFNLGWRDVPFFLTFIVCQVATSRLIMWRRDAEDALRRARDDLEIRVEERTAELKAANEELLHRIAEQRRVEEALQVARGELARVARITTVGELTTSIAHEVNQPLAAIVANADACVAWLGHEQPNLDEARAAAARAVEGATRASGVIKRIRSLIHKSAPERVPVQLNQVIHETAELVAGQAARGDVAISTNLMQGLPDVLGDRIQLQQVILNLMINAIEAMASMSRGDNQLTVTSRCEQAGQVKIVVEDTGGGIRDDVLRRLFEPFFTTRTQGIGMGLAISRSIIEAHGGRLWAESRAGQGSVFQFTLPEAGGASA